jgi:hypothetical protein
MTAPTAAHFARPDIQRLPSPRRVSRFSGRLFTWHVSGQCSHETRATNRLQIEAFAADVIAAPYPLGFFWRQKVHTARKTTVPQLP